MFPYVETDGLAEFREFFSELRLKSGEQPPLAEFQSRILSDYFSGAKENIIVLPKKNGKGTLISALALFHLLTTEQAEIAVVATASNQAKQVFEFARAIVQQTPALRGLFDIKPGFKEIRTLNEFGETDGVLRVYASGDDALDGWLGTLAIVDELHRHKSLETYNILRAGSAGRGALIALTTAGDDDLSPLGVMRQKVYDYPSLRRHGVYTHVLSPDGSLAWHEYGLGEDDDPYDLTLVKQANPLHSIETLKSWRDTASMTAHYWRRFHCGQWVRGEGSLFGVTPWRAKSRPDLALKEGETVRAGLDIGLSSDPTCISVMRWDSPEQRVIAQTIVLRPPSEQGVTLPFEAIKLALRVLAGKTEVTTDVRELFVNGQIRAGKPEESVSEWWEEIVRIRPCRLLGVTFDPRFAAQLAEDLTAEGIPFVQFDQFFKNQSRADMRFYQAFQEGRIFHDGDERLELHAVNVESSAGDDEYFKFEHGAKTGRENDSIIAASMVHDTFSAAPAPAKKKSGRMYTYP